MKDLSNCKFNGLPTRRQTIGFLQHIANASCTFFSMEHMAKLQPCWVARLQSRASIHSDLPEFGTPVTIDNSPGTTCTPTLSLSMMFCVYPDKYFLRDFSAWCLPCSSCPALTSLLKHPGPWHLAHRTCSRSHQGNPKTCTGNSHLFGVRCICPKDTTLIRTTKAQKAPGLLRRLSHLNKPLMG